MALAPAIAALLLAGLLPADPALPPPFPHVITDASTIWSLAPGIDYAQYEMRTADGPLSIHVIAADLRDPYVRFGTMLARDHLVSPGETLTSMAHRAGAVAGINGDYFDINQTNQPLNIVIAGGQLMRMPMRRPALAFGQGRAFFTEFQIEETLRTPRGALALETMNDWPPRGGPVFLTPAYGVLKAVPGVTVLALEPEASGGRVPFGRFRVSAILDGSAPLPPAFYLAFPQPFASNALPRVGEDVAVSERSMPSISAIEDAIGGGPMLVENGRWYPDPDGPSKGEFATRMPASGAALDGAGSLLLFQIDGRQPGLSAGLLQPELAALMIGFGAVSGMQFDGGGSSEMAARLPGDAQAQVLNSPSDGRERRIGDALLLYSDAPPGPPARIAAIPQIVREMPGAGVTVRFALLDGSGRTLCVSPSCSGMHVQDLGNRIVARDGLLRTSVPVEIFRQPARLEILPADPIDPAGHPLRLAARAFDASGYPIALPANLSWRARGGSIDGSGMLRPGPQNVRVSIDAGGTRAETIVTVGSHPAPLKFVQNAIFAAAPANAAGSVQRGVPCEECLTLNYDFTQGEIAAYANTSLALPGRAIAITADVRGDGNGEILRVAVENAIRERFLFGSQSVDWTGWRHVRVLFPGDVAQPLTLKSIYVLSRMGTRRAAHAAGSIALRNVRVVLAGR